MSAAVNLSVILFFLFLMMAVPATFIGVKYLRDPEYRAKLRNIPYRKAFIFYPAGVKRAIITGLEDHFMLGKDRYDIDDDKIISGNILLYDFDSPKALTRVDKGFRKDYAKPEEYGEVAGGNALIQLMKSHFGQIPNWSIMLLAALIVIGFGIVGYQAYEIREILVNGGPPILEEIVDGLIGDGEGPR